MKRSLLATAILLGVVGNAQAETRSLSMGGAGVANGSYIQAGYLNPALMARYEDRDHIGIVFPSLNLEAADRDDLIDKIDQFQNDYEQLEVALNGNDAGAIQAARSNLVQSFSEVEGNVSVGGGAYAKLAIPTSFVSAAIYFNTDLNILTGPRLSGSDINLINTATDIDALDQLESSALVLGNAVSDIGLVLAKRFEVGGNELAVGITPKLQRVDTFAYAATINSFDEDDYDAESYSTDESVSNVDIGVTYSNSSWSIGLAARNLIEHEIDSVSFQLPNFLSPQFLTYEFAPSAVLGFGYNARFMALSLDVDLTANNYLQLSDSSQQLLFGEAVKTQFVRAGVEFDAFRNAQLRLGIRHDLEGTYDDALTAGLGLSPFGRVHLNLTGIYTDDSDFGAGLQLAFTF
ncbi:MULTISPECIES: conjugal transfer protein TraF [Gammaproteobacteria]|uniref:conjugal transfer protein TraF n=1 Tax=Gammaproteobacteria TaxID=1236 RepID=UPI000DCFAE08|nr:MULTISPECIES: conjugal transfer protein TraF [Gammaproteobacteria]RTE87164.1 type IX secretion system membrane protein PorP/SprF [Aliidiomarina sp. B3213]TCZ93048.1 type IX secretion system membrane protein PorP/SprF [Lysobacter sp. N42]